MQLLNANMCQACRGEAWDSAIHSGASYNTDSVGSADVSLMMSLRGAALPDVTGYEVSPLWGWDAFTRNLKPA